MDEIIRFLRARYDEREAKALACDGPFPWKAAEDESDSWIVTDAAGQPLIYDEGTPSLSEAEHIAANDPAAVLRGIAGKRKIVDLAEEQHDGQGMQDVMAEVLHHLAEEFADHPDYNKRMWGPLSSGNPVPE
jgi:hypothetical protein